MATTAPFISKEDVAALRDYVMGETGQVGVDLPAFAVPCH
jgi:hypothetical protein